MFGRTRRRSVVVTVVVALGLIGSLVACEPLPPPQPDAGSALIPCSQADQRVVITASSHLDPSCTYTQGIEITASHVTLDCVNGLIKSAEGADGVGILVHVPTDVDLTDVTIKRCQVEGFVNTIKVTRDGFRDLADGEEFVHSTSDIVVEDSQLRGSRGVGMYVDGYVSDVTIRRNLITGTGSSGIYLETGSKQNHVEGNAIIDNGYRENGAGGTPFTFGGVNLWFWGVGREGISVDGSYENTISGNVFSGNSAGGLFLYKNCGEYPDSGRYFERRDPAADNLIEHNVFIGGRNGVWVASRMGENTLPMECTDPAYVDQPALRVVLDRAPDNTVRENEFRDVTYGVRVEDDGTTVEGNTFSGSGPDRHAIIVGTPWRTSVLGEPVSGTVLRGNTSTIAGNANPYRWVNGEVDSTLVGNTALGEPVGWCEGQPPPRQVFVMVIAVAVANPDGSMPPTPDLTVQTVPALPPCPAAG